MPSKRFILIYPSGDREHISTTERDELLLSSSIRKLNDFTYLYTAKPRIFHDFAALEPLKANIESHAPIRRFLPGYFIFEHAKRRQRELMETPEGLAIRLQTA